MLNPIRYGLAVALTLLVGAAIGAGANTSAPPGPEGHAAVDGAKLINVDANGKEKVVENPGVIVKRGYLGVELTELTPELRTHFGAPADAGVMVARVVADSPADKAGLHVGDIIVALADQPVASSWDVRARVRPMSEGASLALVVARDGQTQNLTATVIERQRREVDYAPFLMKIGDTDRIMAFHPPLAGLDGSNGLPGVGALQPTYPSPREEQLERKLKALEKRLNDLESRLPKN